MAEAQGALVSGGDSIVDGQVVTESKLGVMTIKTQLELCNNYDKILGHEKFNNPGYHTGTAMKNEDFTAALKTCLSDAFTGRQTTPPPELP